MLSEWIAYAIKLQQKQRTSNYIILILNITLETIYWQLYGLIICSFLYLFIQQLFGFMVCKSRGQLIGEIATRDQCKQDCKMREQCLAKEPFCRSYLVIKIWATHANEEGQNALEKGLCK